MADPVGQYSFDNLTQSGQMKIPSKDDRAVTFTVDTFGGSTAFAVFTAAGGRPWKRSLPRKVIYYITELLIKMAKDPKPCREVIMLNQWEETDGGKRKLSQHGQIGFGIGEDMVFFIDIAANDLQGRHLFPFKPEPQFDFSNTSLTERDHIVAQIKWLLETLTNISVVAERLSQFKRTGGGGNKGSFNNNKSGGGNRQGGYQNNNNSNANQGTFGGGGSSGGAPAASGDDDLYI